MDKQIWMGKLLNKINNQGIFFILLAILMLFGFLLRFHNINSNPPELFSDEITDLVSARKIIETGSDINGEFGIYFYNRLEMGPPIYGYLAAISSKLVNNDEIGLRLPAVIFGTAAILIIFLVSKELFNNNFIALFSAFVFTFIPWTIHFSRVGWEPSLLIFFIGLSILLYYKFINKDKVVFLYLSFIAFALTIYTNRSAEFLSPTILLSLVLINRNRLTKHFKHLVLAGVLFIILSLPFLHTSLNNPLMHERAKRISTFSTGINVDNLKTFFHNYTSHISPSFLFENGDPNLRHGARTGVLFWSLAPFIIFGIWKIVINIKGNSEKFIFILFLIFPLGGSLTNDGVPHATRTLIGAIVLSILSGIGGQFLFNKRPIVLKLFTTLCLITFLIELILFIPKYFKYYPLQSAIWWEYGHNEVFSYIRDNSNKYGLYCLGNLNYWNEETLVNYYLPETNLKITTDVESLDCLKENSLMVLPASNEVAETMKHIHTTFDLEGMPLWRFYSSTL